MCFRAPRELTRGRRAGHRENFPASPPLRRKAARNARAYSSPGHHLRLVISERRGARGRRGAERNDAVAADPIGGLRFNRFGYGARPGDGESRRAIRKRGVARRTRGAPRRAYRKRRVALDPDRSCKTSTPTRCARKWSATPPPWPRSRDRRCPPPEVAAILFPAASPATAAGPEMAAVGSMAPGKAMKPETPPQQTAFRTDAQARLAQAYAAPIGFVERLVAFWSNHFCVSVAKSEIGRGAAGAFEREAIRPHVLGRFADMLLAVERHPAMLNFLDNAAVDRPEFAGGAQQQVGSQRESRARNPGAAHDGRRLGLYAGRRHPTRLHPDGLDDRRARRQARRTRNLRLQRQRPRADRRRRCSAASTCRTASRRARRRWRISRARARRRTISHSSSRAISSPMRPMRACVQRLAEFFRETDGDLATLARALVNDDAAWSAPPTKIRNPWELTVAAYRAFARTPEDPGPALNALNLLGMPLWQPGGPNGFSDDIGRLDLARGDEDAASTRRPVRPSDQGCAGAARAGRRHSRPERVRRDPRDGGARREPGAGLRAAAPVARISTEMTMSPFALAPSEPSRPARRRRRDFRLGDDPTLGERRGRARSAPRRRDPARRPRRPLGRRADRRSRTTPNCIVSSRCVGTASIPRFGSTISSASIRR